MEPSVKPPILGLRENWQQFSLLVLTVGFVGSLVGLERTVVPLICKQEFGLASKTAMVYPVLLAAVSDVAHPQWRATSLGVYRFWRDLGYAVGALLAGLIADAVGMGAAIHVIAALTMLSGLVAGFRMYETHLTKQGT